MSHRVGNPVQPWRWAYHLKRDTWHILLPAGNGTYRRALCGYMPKDGWGPMRAAPPSPVLWTVCITCHTRAWRQGAPIS